MISKSYNTCHCGSNCAYFNETKCWGQVDAIDEVDDGDGYNWVHVCEGHHDVYDGGEYISEDGDV